MDPQLRVLLDRSAFHQGALREVAALLPADDVALAALLAELCADANQLGFLLTLTAALDASRSVDAALLDRAAGLCLDAMRLGCFAWKMSGDVSAALLAALARDRFNLALHAGILFVLAAWCVRLREVPVPPGFAAHARALARHPKHPKDALILLAALASLWPDADFLAVLRQHHPTAINGGAGLAAATYAGELIKLFDRPAGALIPATVSDTTPHVVPVRRAVAHVGRNDPCPCGSGQKYKRCCADADRARLRLSSPVAGLTGAELHLTPETGLTLARLKALQPPELARLDPRKVPNSLRTAYLMQCTGLHLLDRSVEALEVMTFDDDKDFGYAWDFVMFFVLRAGRKDVAERLARVRDRHPTDGPLPECFRLLLARDDPAEELRVLDALARRMLTDTDPEELTSHAHGLLCSRHTALGILVCHGFIASLGTKQAGFLLKMVLEARDRLELPADDPFADLLERRLAEETSDEGADAARLREARRRLETKAAEVRALKEEIDDQRRRLDRQERAAHEARRATAPASPPAAAPADDPATRDLRARLARLKGNLHERAAERLALRHELEAARDQLETLRAAAPPATAVPNDPDAGAGDEAALYVPAGVEGNQPLRLVEYPARFRETLETLPRGAARAALRLLGRLAGGEPAAFAGVVQLKACHGVLRLRVGSEHRLLFRLEPERVRAVDFINRRDLDRTVKRLRAAGG